MALNKRVRRRLILLCVLVFVLVVTSVAGYFFTQWNRKRQVEVAARDGMAAYLEGDYISALPKLSKAVEGTGTRASITPSHKNSSAIDIPGSAAHHFEGSQHLTA